MSYSTNPDQNIGPGFGAGRPSAGPVTTAYRNRAIIWPELREGTPAEDSAPVWPAEGFGYDAAGQHAFDLWVQAFNRWVATHPPVAAPVPDMPANAEAMPGWGKTPPPATIPTPPAREESYHYCLHADMVALNAPGEPAWPDARAERFVPPTARTEPSGGIPGWQSHLPSTDGPALDAACAGYWRNRPVPYPVPLPGMRAQVATPPRRRSRLARVCRAMARWLVPPDGSDTGWGANLWP